MTEVDVLKKLELRGPLQTAVWTLWTLSAMSTLLSYTSGQ